MRVGYNHNYTTQTSDLLSSATATQQSFVAQSDTFASASSSTVLTNYIRPNDLNPIAGCLLNSGNAQTVANDLLTLWGVRRRLYQVTVPVALALALDLGQLVTLQWPMDNLASGALGIIVEESLRSADAAIVLTVLV